MQTRPRAGGRREQSGLGWKACGRGGGCDPGQHLQLSARDVAFHLQPVTALQGWERSWDSPVEAGDVKLLAFSVLAGT